MQSRDGGIFGGMTTGGGFGVSTYIATSTQRYLLCILLVLVIEVFWGCVEVCAIRLVRLDPAPWPNQCSETLQHMSFAKGGVKGCRERAPINI